MKAIYRNLRRWLFRAFASLILLAGLLICPLAFPNPMFSNKISHGNHTFYSDIEFSPELKEVVREVDRRLKAVEIYDPNSNEDIFLCHSPKLYSFFAHISNVPIHVPGFNLSLLNNSFISMTGLSQRYSGNACFPSYSAIGGDPAQNIAHELMHDYMVNVVGFFNSLGLPRWKTEGYAEYGAGMAASREDTVLTLVHRIEIMQSEICEPRAREYYSWGLTMEYLSDIEGLGFSAIMNDSLTREDSYRKMLAWFDYRQSGSKKQ